jgi:NAD+ synthase (glutamine-hydrolysing)
MMNYLRYGCVTANPVCIYALSVPQIRLALVQLNPIVGDLAGNVAKCLEAVKTAAASGADVVVLPEMVVTGYPVEDLALRPTFQQASELATESFAAKLKSEGLGDVLVFVGYLRRTTDVEAKTLGTPRGGPMNCAGVIYDGVIQASYAKHHLPNYGVFDEYRYFVPGNNSLLVRAFGIDIAVAICEDLWQDGGPVAQVKANGAGLLVVLNGSPYERDKDDVRLELVTRRAREADVTLAYVNMVGGQDELVFEGDSVIVSASGEVIARAKQFETDLLFADLDLPASGSNTVLPTGELVTELAGSKVHDHGISIARVVEPRLEPLAEVYAALVTALRDYVIKNGFKSVALGLSGGIDSALVAAIAADAIGATNVYGVSMPSKYSSDHSKSDAQDSAKRIGLNMRTVEIEPMMKAYLENLELTGLAEENLQARVRGMTLMGISNQEGHLVLATGNKSELSVGYSTIYGDAVGGFAPIMDVPKFDVWALANWRNLQAKDRSEVAPIPEASISKEPSAELRPGQQDSDSLPNYEELDAILLAYVEQDKSADQIIATGFDPETVHRILKLTDRAEYKRRQYPPGPKVSGKAFGKDRRMPLTNFWSE